MHIMTISAVGNVSGYRCMSDCRSRGREFDPFVEIDHEIISAIILLLPLIHSRRVVVSYKRKYVHKLLVNRLFKPAQEKVWLGELTVPVDLGRKATKQTNKQTNLHY